MDAKEERGKKDRDRYLRMTSEEQRKKQKKRHEAYQPNKAIKDSTQEQGKKKYANMEPTQKIKKVRMRKAEIHKYAITTKES